MMIEDECPPVLSGPGRQLGMRETREMIATLHLPRGYGCEYQQGLAWLGPPYCMKGILYHSHGYPAILE